MPNMLVSFRQNIKAYREWFRVIGNALNSNPNPQSARDLARAYCEAGREFNGRESSMSDECEVTAAIVHSLAAFERCKLISGEMEERFTKSLRFPVPERVATLTKRGQQALSWADWHLSSLFARVLMAELAKSAWKPFATAVGVAGTLATILKLVLLWNTEKTALTAGVVGVVVFTLRLVSVQR